MTDRIPTAIVNDLIARATERQPHLAARLERAGTIAQHGFVEQQPDGRWLVGSGSQAGTEYTVDPCAKTCRCPDFTFRHGTHQGWCSHRLAVGIIIRGTDEARRLDMVAWGGVLCA